MFFASRHYRLFIFQRSTLTGARSWQWPANLGTKTENHFDVDEILNQFVDIDTLALENIIDPNDGTDDEMSLMKPSQYYTIDNLPVNMSNSSKFNVISLNAQSINAKFDILLTFLEVARQQNITLHVICIQETWVDEKSDLSLYQIEGYTCISQGKRCSSHGGLITYVDSKFNTSVMDIKINSPIWEGLFVAIQDIETEKEIVVGNIYHPHMIMIIIKM